MRRWGAWLGLILFIGAAAGVFPSLPLSVELFDLVYLLRIASIAGFGTLLILGRWRDVSTGHLQFLAIFGFSATNLNAIPYLLATWEDERLHTLLTWISLPALALGSISAAYLWGCAVSLIRHPDPLRTRLWLRVWAVISLVSFALELPVLLDEGRDMIPRMMTVPGALHVAQALWTLSRVCVLIATVLACRVASHPNDILTAPRRIHRLMLASYAISFLQTIFLRFAYPGPSHFQQALGIFWEGLVPIAQIAALATVAAIARNTTSEQSPSAVAPPP